MRQEAICNYISGGSFGILQNTSSGVLGASPPVARGRGLPGEELTQTHRSHLDQTRARNRNSRPNPTGTKRSPVHIKGLSNKEIGGRLALFRGSVKACLRQKLFAAVGVHTGTVGEGRIANTGIYRTAGPAWTDSITTDPERIASRGRRGHSGGYAERFLPATISPQSAAAERDWAWLGLVIFAQLTVDIAASARQDAVPLRPSAGPTYVHSH